MAEGFDKAKASTDLKYLLKMDPISQDAVVDSKNKRKVKRTEDTKTFEDGYGTQHPQHRKRSDRSKNTNTNSNGNALLDSADAGSMHTSITVSNVSQSVQIMKNKDKDNSSATHMESRSISSAPLSKKYSEKLDSFEVVNSNKRASSGLKNRKNLENSEFVRNPIDSVSNVRKGSNGSYNRYSSATKNQRKNYDSFRNGDGEKEPFVKNPEPHRNEIRGDKNHSRVNEGRNQMEKSPEMHNISASNNRPLEPEEELSAEFLHTLEENGILILEKKNPRFSKAKYYCELCDFHLNTKADCDKHMTEYRHSRKKKLNETDAVLKCILEPNQQQFAALTAAVDKVYEEHGINENEMKQRADIVRRLERMLKENVPDVLTFMYGSSLTGFGLKTADINVNLISADKDKKLTLLLKETYRSLNNLTDSGFSNLRSDFTAKIPGFFLTDDLTGLTVHVIIHCHSAHCSSELLSIYSDFDIRVKKLAVAFRYWAHLCGLDQKCDGFIPPQALNLMVIYFLQVINPQLVPIIQPPKVTGDEVGDYRKDAPGFVKMRSKVMKVSMKSSNDMSIGELWFRLLQFYCLEFDTPNVVVCVHSNQNVPRNTKPWNSKKLAVEDPYMLKRNITRMVTNSRIYEYWEDSIHKALHYFGFPRDAVGNAHIPIESVMKGTNKETSESCQQIEVEQNKKEIIQNANIKFSGGDDKRNLSSEKEKDSAKFITASQKEIMESKGQTQKLKDCQDSNILRNESRSGSDSESDGIMDSDDDEFDDVAEQMPSITSLENSDLGVSDGLSFTYDNSCILQRIDGKDTSSGADIKKEKLALCVCKSNENKGVMAGSICSYCAQSLTDSITGQDMACNKNLGNRALSSSVVTLDYINNADVTDVHTTDNKRLSQSSLYSSSEEVTDGARGNVEFPEEKTNAFSLLAGRDCHYEFSKDFLTDGKGPVLVCTYCEIEGHLKNACPEDKLPEVLPLPPLTPFHLKMLSETLNKVPSIVGLHEFGFAKRMDFMHGLEDFIRGQFRDANLALFGSSCNGFGFDKSDMDICLTFSQRKAIDKPWLIESLAKRMKQCKELLNVQAIPTAKVPIVKFFVRSIHLDGDISLYNILAQHNTKLLLRYSEIDQRVQILGYTIKNFAKVCDIGDASRGSLSSYAYILMMIYYLQQVVPPVIPVLQELYEGKEKPKLMINGCDAWFMDDLSRLGKLWPEKGRNKMSVAELWLGFLRFYVEEFDYKELVVSIRLKEPLTRFEKFWNGENIAIEDPFDVNHNLGSGLSRKMNNFIFKTFINGRMLYGSPIDDNMDMFKTYSRPYDYFFDTYLLSENRPPNVRGCRLCGKMGHLAVRCPTARNEKDEQQGLQRQQKQLQQQIKQQPIQQSQTPAAEQQRTPPSLQQDLREQQKQPASSQQRQQSQPTQGSQQQRQLSQTQQQNQPYQQAQQQKQGSQQQQKTTPSQPQQQQQKPLLEPQQLHESRPSAPPQQQQSQPSNPLHLQQQEKQFSILPQQQQKQPLLQQQVQLQPFQQQRQTSQQERKQPSQQQEQIQPLQQKEQRQPPQQEQIQSSQHEERRQPPQQEQIQSSQHEERRQPPQQEQIQSSQHEERRQPSHPVQRQPSQQEQIQTSQQRQPPLQQGRRPPPLQQEERRQRLQQKEQKQHPQQQEQRQPPPQEEQRKPTQQVVQGHPLQYQDRRQPPQKQDERRQPPQKQDERRQTFELEKLSSQSSEKDREQKQPFQSQYWPPSQSQQQFRQSPHQPQQETRHPFQQMTQQSEQQHQSLSPQPQQQFSQPLLSQQQFSHSPQPQRQFSQSPQPQQQFIQPHQQYRQSTQPPQQFNQSHQQNSQQKTQPLHQQQQGQPPQQQFQQQNPPPLLQQWQPPKKQQQLSERDINESRDERDHWQKGPAGNMNVNSSGPGLPYNFIDHRNVQAGTPSMTSGMSSQVFHNSNYSQRHNTHHQQPTPASYRPNFPLLSSIRQIPQPLMSPIPRYNFSAFGQIMPPPLPPGMTYPPGFNHAPHNLGSGYSHANYDSRGHNLPGTQYSGQGSRGHNAGDQFMSPAVQNMFDSARGHVLNDSSDYYHRHK